MTQIVEPDALAELVWSPRAGLNIKLAEEKPYFMGGVGPSDMEFYNCENTKKEDHITSLTTCHVTKKAASCPGLQNQGAADESYEHLFEDRMTTGRSPLKVEPMMQCRPCKHVKRTNVKMDTVKTKKDGCFSDPFLENAQVESHGSMESCRSANFLTSRKRKCIFEQRLILGSKRIKNQFNSSSFMKWISNTLKGLKSHNVYGPSVRVCDQSRSLGQGKHFGFHNVFQSLFSPETITRFEKKATGILKETVLAEKCSHESLGYVKQISFHKQVTTEAPTYVIDIIRKLQLSRTDILKWMNSRSMVAHLDGFFLRLRVAKPKEGEGKSRYHVACITGRTPWNELKQSIRVKVGHIEFLIQSQYVSNSDFLKDELTAWWQENWKNGGIPALKDLKSKVTERRTLGM